MAVQACSGLEPTFAVAKDRVLNFSTGGFEPTRAAAVATTRPCGSAFKPQADVSNPIKDLPASVDESDARNSLMPISLGSSRKTRGKARQRWLGSTPTFATTALADSDCPVGGFPPTFAEAAVPHFTLPAAQSSVSKPIRFSRASLEDKDLRFA